MNLVNKILLIIIFGTGNLSLKAQFSLNFPDSTATWRMYTTEFYITESYSYQSRYYVHGDSIINGNTYSMLYSGLWHDSDSSGTLVGFYRIDSSKVYFIDRSSIFFAACGGYIDSENDEQILYDYDINVGDTMVYPNSEFSISNYSLILDSISSKAILGQSHRMFYFSPASPGTYVANPTAPLYWIEGIGSCYGFFPAEPCFERWPQFLCMHSEGNDFDNDFTWINKSCTSLGLNEEQQENYLSIFPNPNNGTFNLQSTNASILNYSILTSDGRLIYSGDIENNSFKFQLTLPNGSYLLLTESNIDRTVNKLIIVN